MAETKKSLPLNANAPEFLPAPSSPNSHLPDPPPELSPDQFSQNPHCLYPPSEFSPARSPQNPHFLYPPPELSPAFYQKPLFHYPPPRPSMFYCHRAYGPLINKPLKPNKAFCNGNVKPRKPMPIKPLRWQFCNPRNLPPRLLKPKEVTKNRNLSANPVPPPPKEENVETFLSGKTSVMIRNIPNDFGRNDLLKILDTHCKNENKEADSGCDENQNRSSYDFLYLPMDFVNRANLGYAFVNFTTSIGAERFRRDLDQFIWNNPGKKKICEITVAKYQGKEDFTKHFKDSRFPCHCDSYLPVILSPPSDGFVSYTLTNLGLRVGLRGGGPRRG